MRRTVLDTLQMLLGSALFAGSALALLWLFDLMEVSR
jgi:hypothetical protein